MTYHAKVIAGGKIVIPAELRREFGIKDGDSLIFESGADDGISVRTFEQTLRYAQREFRNMVGEDYTVDQFLQERRADWGEE